MKVKEAITGLDSLYTNTRKMNDKIQWLSDLDRRIYKEIICTHEDAPVTSFDGYSSTDLEKELIAGDEYSEMYITYLVCKVDYYNGEWGRYNNSTAQFNELFRSFAAQYNKTHLPLQGV